jgi:hypothetical protein
MGQEMINVIINKETSNNNESLFTELFFLLTRYENLSLELPILTYNTDELILMHQYIDNAIDVLLKGLQEVGHLMGLSSQKNSENINEINNIGFFISAVTNLTEALNTLRSDTDYLLKKRGILNY